MVVVMHQEVLDTQSSFGGTVTANTGSGGGGGGGTSNAFVLLVQAFNAAGICIVRISTDNLSS